MSHLRTFLIIYLTLVPIVYSRVWLWATPLVAFFVSYALLGLEAAAVECERPVNECANHMPLDAFAAAIADSVAQTLKHSASVGRAILRGDRRASAIRAKDSEAAADELGRGGRAPGGASG